MPARARRVALGYFLVFDRFTFSGFGISTMKRIIVSSVCAFCTVAIFKCFMSLPFVSPRDGPPWSRTRRAVSP